MKNYVKQGENLALMNELADKSVNMIYCDPPFYTQRTQKLSDKNNNEYSFEDSWSSIEEYYNFIKIRFDEMHRVLADDGLIFVHCDRSASHHIRLALDESFGRDYFQSEIIWRYKRWSNSKKGLLNNHQNIYMYSKKRKFKFNTIYEEYSPTTNIDQIMQERSRENNKTTYKVDKDGKPIVGKPKKGVPLSDVWDIPYLNPKAKERVGYPTQKPILLLERIIEISTDKDDVVLDPFCGSGTTLVASQFLNRQYIGFDISEEAVRLTQKRLKNPVKTESALLKKGIGSYENKSSEELSILKAIDATVVQRNKAVDGYLKKTIGDLPVPVRIQKTGETIDEIVGLMQRNSKTKESKVKIIIKLANVGLLDSSPLPDDFICIEGHNLQIEERLTDRFD